MTGFDFTTMPDRRGHDAIAVELQQRQLRPGFDPIPLWIADMSFPTAPSVTEAIVQRAAHPIYGYFAPSDAYYNAIIRWQAESFGVTGLEKQHIGYENGVLGGVTSALQVMNPAHGPVLVHSPTYIGFTSQLERNGYPIELSPLRPDESGVLRMDYDDMERRLRERHIHTAILCSPHNPSGRVWERRELEQAMELFRKYDVNVISDEIWADLTLFGNRHIPTQSISEDARQRTVAFYAPSKTFNLAGLVGSYHIAYNARLADLLRQYEARCHYNDMSVLSMHALIGAYTPEGRAWMEQLRHVLEANIDLACAFFGGYAPDITLRKPEGTYLIVPEFDGWCRRHGKTLDELLDAGAEVGVLWHDGRKFHVPCGVRMALGLPTKKLEQALQRLQQYVL